MLMKRREFLAAIGATAAAVALNGVPLAQVPQPSSAGAEDIDLRPGDVFTIAGRYAINPVTRQSTGHLQSFMVTAVVGNSISMIPSNGSPIDKTLARAGWATR